jgi:hypothetical protein
MNEVKLFETDRRVLTFQDALEAVIDEPRFSDLSIAQVLGAIEVLKMNLWNRMPDRSGP